MENENLSVGKKLQLDVHLNLVPEVVQHDQDLSLAACSVLQNELHCGTCDLHIHSAASDGTDSAGDILKKAMENRLYAIALTDRDTMEGVRKMLVLVEKLYKLGVEIPHFIRGLEITTRGFDQPIDILGYFPIQGSKPVEGFLEEQRQSRRERNRQMCDALQACGLPVTLRELEAEGAFVVGRIHAANILVRKGFAMTIKEAFDTWLDVGKPAFVPYTAPSVETVLASIRQANGVPVLASPLRYGWLSRQDNMLEERLSYLQSHGLLGVEVVYSGMNEAQLDEMGAVAANLRLLATSGSGYKGFTKRDVRMFDRSMDFSRWIP